MGKTQSYIGFDKAVLSLGISHDRLMRLMKNHLIPFYKHPGDGSPIFKKEDLDNFVHSRESNIEKSN